MDDEVVSLNLSSLEELVLDEEKIVTYAYLSNKLCIHVNESKVLLNTFLRKTRNNNPNVILNVKYIISGIDSGNKAIVRVMHERDTENFRKSLKHIFFEHIYSISKGATVDDIALLATKYFDDFSMAIGLIKNSSCVKHSIKEITVLKQNSQDFSKNENIKKYKENLNKDYKIEKESQNNISVTCLSPTKRKNSSEKHNNESVAKKQKSVKDITKNQRGIGTFFSKQNESTKDSNGCKTLNDSIKKEILNNDIETVNHKHEISGSPNSNPNKNEILKSSDNLKQNQHATNNNKSLSSIVKNAKVDKKRKRVLKVSDSDTEEECSITENNVAVVKEEQGRVSSDNEIPPTPTTDMKITSRKINLKKKKKIVDKTYTDEDGYILTRKEEVYESGSDSEGGKEQVQMNEKITQQSIRDSVPEEKDVNKIVSRKSKKKISSPQKGKQQTMMNFFKKMS